jgi:hypothetical protein
MKADISALAEVETSFKKHRKKNQKKIRYGKIIHVKDKYKIRNCSCAGTSKTLVTSKDKQTGKFINK